MADGGIQRSIFIVKYDSSIDFMITEKISVEEPGKLSVFSRQDKSDVPDQVSNPGL